MRFFCWLSIILLGCSSEPDTAIDEGLFCEVQDSVWMDTAAAVDLVIVIDDSVSMQDKQVLLQTGLRSMADLLESFGGRQLPDLRIAVLSADSSRDSEFQVAPQLNGCSPPDGAYISDTVEPWWTCSDNASTRCRRSNYEGELSDALPCIGTLGVNGSDTQQLLATALSALDGSTAANEGFLRAHALLLLVLVSDSDDASPMAPSEYAEQFKSLKERPEDVAVGTVRRESSPRLEAFESLFPNRNSAADIDGEGWDNAVLTLPGLFADTLDIRCLDSSVDTTDLDPEQPGVQLECIVSLESKVDGTERNIPQCTMAAVGQPAADTAQPCWWIGPHGDSTCDYRDVKVVAEEILYESIVDLHCVGTCQ